MMGGNGEMIGDQKGGEGMLRSEEKMMYEGNGDNYLNDVNEVWMQLCGL
jgi:hypothetical protein